MAGVVPCFTETKQRVTISSFAQLEIMADRDIAVSLQIVNLRQPLRNLVSRLWLHVQGAFIAVDRLLISPSGSVRHAEVQLQIYVVRVQAQSMPEGRKALINLFTLEQRYSGSRRIFSGNDLGSQISAGSS